MKEIKSEMTGVIDRILVAVGDEVTVGQDVVVIESMKSLINAATKEAGKIIEIKVEPGDFVEEDDVLMLAE